MKIIYSTTEKTIYFWAIDLKLECLGRHFQRGCWEWEKM